MGFGASTHRILTHGRKTNWFGFLSLRFEVIGAQSENIGYLDEGKIVNDFVFCCLIVLIFRYWLLFPRASAAQDHVDAADTPQDKQQKAYKANCIQNTHFYPACCTSGKPNKNLDL